MRTVVGGGLRLLFSLFCQREPLSVLTSMIAVTPPPIFCNLGGVHLLRDYFVVARISARLEIRKPQRCCVREGCTLCSHRDAVGMRLQDCADVVPEP